LTLPLTKGTDGAATDSAANVASFDNRFNCFYFLTLLLPLLFCIASFTSDAKSFFSAPLTVIHRQMPLLLKWKVVP